MSAYAEANLLAPVTYDCICSPSSSEDRLSPPALGRLEARLLRVRGQPGQTLSQKQTHGIFSSYVWKLFAPCQKHGPAAIRTPFWLGKDMWPPPGFTTKIFIIITTTESMSSINQWIIHLRPPPSQFYRLGRGRGACSCKSEGPSEGGPASHFTSFVSRSREHIPSTRWKVARRPAPASPAFCSGPAAPPPLCGLGRRARAAGTRGGGAVAMSTHPARSPWPAAGGAQGAGRGRDRGAGGGAPPALQWACAVEPPGARVTSRRDLPATCAPAAGPEANPLGVVGRQLPVRKERKQGCRPLASPRA